MDEEKVVVLYPAPGMGHLVSLVELGKRLILHRPSLSITVLITTLPFDYNTAASAAYISSVSSAFPAITFQPLPTLATLRHPSTYPNTEDILFELIPRNNPNVRRYLLSLSVSAFIIDFFCTAAFDVGKSLGIPTYFFFISGASALALFLNFPTIDETTKITLDNFRNSRVLFSIPGLPTVPATALPDSMLDRGDTYKNFVNVGAKMAESDGVVVNSFEGFEPRVVRALRTGLCVPEGSRTPPVYCVGPLISMDDSGSESRHECLSWLDSQPNRSVVFICFGSSAVFDRTQLGEIAVGLERSGHRFLWVVKDPPPIHDVSKRFTKPPDPNLNEVLPIGFLDRIKGRGIVVKTWAPQKSILKHESIGAFVSHCGWNSTLEAVWYGVPLVGWPLFAEQRFNQEVLVEEVGVALPLEKMKIGSKFVMAQEIERRLREIMESLEGDALRRRIMDMKREAMFAVDKQGSSTLALATLVDSWKP